MKYFCAQRGCAVDVPDVVTEIPVLDKKSKPVLVDGVPQVERQSKPGELPKDCPTCGHPFFVHPSPTTLGLDVATGAPLEESADPSR